MRGVEGEGREGIEQGGGKGGGEGDRERKKEKEEGGGEVIQGGRREGLTPSVETLTSTNSSSAVINKLVARCSSSTSL